MLLSTFFSLKTHSSILLISKEQGSMVFLYVGFFMSAIILGALLLCYFKSKDNPLFSYNDDPNAIDIKFNKKIYSKKELENYSVKLYLYKDEKYKTFINEIKFPIK